MSHYYRSITSPRHDGRDLLHRVYRNSTYVPFADKDDILHQIRGRKEEYHRYKAALSAWCDAKSFTINGGNYNFVLKKDMSHRDKLFDMIPCYNKSVMLYILDPNREANCYCDGILKFLDIWMYRQWFEPYKSDIDFERYIARTTLLRWKKDAQKPSLEEINKFHKGLCHDLTDGMLRDMPSESVDYLKKRHLDTQNGTFETEEDIIATFKDVYVVQPTFRSFFIVMQHTQGFKEGPFRAGDVGDIPVYLVCTECHNEFHDRETYSDIMGPCCSIHTTLKAAIRFIMNLERKQPAAKKTLPCRLKYRAIREYETIDIEKEAEAMGWKTEWHGKFPLDQPCSTWVDRNKYTEWTGAGAVKHASKVVCAIKYLGTTRRKVPLDHWWWYDSSDIRPTVTLDMFAIRLACLLFLYCICVSYLFGSL
ncbi:hypothetical protein FPSE_12200 [Fusarium pseudograminearum CS3096]|uniref:Uncharacterized protein n=1 Tax=Fusarium pseudograminearum (strain CS3096) TaxID=1028729 RepID=K3V440_FUSPC|nr:hypothetical protein FPSE_12200 [Fusarium pseudograminearum CS3096]EKJ67619.1 hypothetical protein FPSE_12200 [Fusarium pseudograminearum CS3096]